MGGSIGAVTSAIMTWAVQQSKYVIPGGVALGAAAYCGHNLVQYLRGKKTWVHVSVCVMLADAMTYGSRVSVFLETNQGGHGGTRR